MGTDPDRVRTEPSKIHERLLDLRIHARAGLEDVAVRIRQTLEQMRSSR